MPRLPTNAPQFDPLYSLILISLTVFLVGMLITNEQARLILAHPFG
ncbi:hypothetical protein B0I00_0228 [Novosphingobium kunmingense]|uniref:Uncharacterized protein n=1 Tax=Novosphingobium kunmingense TaxID=1211806 RepID=A0A2N0I1I2_9SPHN|nr:hypothetical protein [Novosphingobium kunmingense]PKB25047.1 hypothetical protein B0I00_0228 [Novosphingobium kunmingense]